MKRVIATALCLTMLGSTAAMANPVVYRSNSKTVVHVDKHGKHHVQRKVIRRDTHKRGHHWRRGERLPPNYRTHRVNDWQRYHLHRPPAGHYWTRVDNNYVLVAATTGLIASIIAGSR
jgi:Ni/Co efflux regulator RcnB